MSAPPLLSIVIPAYNAERVLRSTIDAVQAHAARNGWSLQLIVAFSRGSDATEQVLEDARSAYDNLVVVDTTSDFGKGGAVRGGMSRATGRYRGFIDADNGVSFEQIDGALPLLERFDIIIGSRYVEGGSAGRRSVARIALSRGGNLLFRVLLGLRFADTRAPLKLFRGIVADRLFHASRLNGFGFDTEVLFLADRLGYRIFEHPVRWEAKDESTVRVRRDALRSLLEIIQIRWHWLRGGYEPALRAHARETVRARAS